MIEMGLSFVFVQSGVLQVGMVVNGDDDDDD